MFKIGGKLPAQKMSRYLARSSKNPSGDKDGQLRKKASQRDDMPSAMVEVMVLAILLQSTGL